MDSYEYDPETQDALPQSGDGEAVPDDPQKVPAPEPVDTSWEGVPLPESTPAADPDLPNPDAQAAQTPPKAPENEAVIPADAPVSGPEPVQAQAVQAQTMPEQSAQGQVIPEPPVQRSAPQEQNAPEQAVPPQNVPEQPAPKPPQAEAPCQPEVIVCPRCHNTIPFQNFCPVCAFSLRGMPPAQPAPPAPPVIPYGAPPVSGMAPNAPYPPYGYRPQQPYTPPAAPMPPQVPPAAPGIGTPGFSGYLPPMPPPPYGAPYPPPYAKPQKKSKGLIILGVVLAGVAALCTIVVLVLTAIMFSANVAPRPEDRNPFSDYFGNSDEYVPPFNGGDEQLPPGEVYPQYFIGDTVTKNDIVYDFDSCRTEQKYGETFIVVGITVQNKSGESFTLTPDLFRLENAMGGSYDYYGEPDTFHSPLERVVLMPGEKASKNLTYVFDGGSDVDYIPLYVLDGNGNTLFFVYLQLYE